MGFRGNEVVDSGNSNQDEKWVERVSGIRVKSKGFHLDSKETKSITLTPKDQNLSEKEKPKSKKGSNSLFLSCNSQLQTSQSQILLQLKEHLEYPKQLKTWYDRKTDFCSSSPSANLNISCEKGEEKG
ncbi:hypothetical protein F3Y22_tig00008706pilonHSYRG00085 [Hibiscus syriacus]|uniref:Uncharacterized protein n=1 Tax=Hibiscus syriacus TaxID=106335 RepID=A0A6A3C9W0_HIBSY|nr:hypothetical protein F3Y22_tig00008706pilonHSYRG00085 [Hibiscus syriacus]